MKKKAFFLFLQKQFKTSRIRETLNILTDADSSTDIIFFLRSKFFVVERSPNKIGEGEIQTFMFQLFFFLSLFCGEKKIGAGLRFFFHTETVGSGAFSHTIDYVAHDRSLLHFCTVLFVTV